MRQNRFIQFTALSFFLFTSFFSFATPVQAVNESVTSISLSSSRVTPGFALQFSVHDLPNVRQNVNRNEPVSIPRDWLVEIGKDESYPSGIYGVKAVYFPATDLVVDADNVYTMVAPLEEGYYRVGIKNGVGDWFAFEYFQVSDEPFFTIRPPRSFEQGETVEFRLYDRNGQPWSLDVWGNQAGRYNFDVYSFGQGGPVTYATPDGSTPVRIQRVGAGRYTFPASQTVGEYYAGFNSAPGVGVHSSSFDVVLDSTPVVVPQPEIEPEEVENVIPPVLEPFPDQTPNPDADAPLAERRTPDSSVSREVNPEVACSLQIGKAYRAKNNPAVYMVVEPRRSDGSYRAGKVACTRRVFDHERTFFTYFTSWNEVIVDDRIKNIPNDELGFLPLGPKYDPKYGALVKTVSDPKVYVLLGGYRYWLSSEEVFKRLGYQASWIEDVAEEFLALYYDGETLVDTTRHPNYTLVKYRGDAKVYRLEPDTADSTRTVKRHITTEEAFDRLGYRADRILTIEKSETYPDGEPLTATRKIRLEP